MTSKFLKTLPLLVLGLLTAPTAFAQVTANLSSRFLARGEYARLEISVPGGEAEVPPAMPDVPGVRIEGGRQTLRAQRGAMGRSMEFSYIYVVSSTDVGKHVIPGVTIISGGNRMQSPPVEFTVFDPDQLQMSEIESDGRKINYFAAFQTTKLKPFEGEALPVEIKIYVPRSVAQTVQDWGIPEFERDGVTSWRFEPSESRGEVMILGQPYYALAYPSTMAPSRQGKCGIGPATLRLTTMRVVMDGFPRNAYQEVFLNIPKLELDAQPLPDGAPKGFDNAIGQFQIQASLPKTELNEGESLAVSLTVSGSGNLDTVHAPKLADDTGWKVYAPITIPRGEERRRLAGSTSFHQGLLPLEIKQLIPPFQLVYFDPADSTYKTATTEPIPVTMLPSTTKPPLASNQPPSAMPVPIERMTDILALVKPAQLIVPAGLALPGWLGHAIGGFLALILIFKAIWMKIRPSFKKDPVREAKLAELQSLSKIPANDDVAFLKAAGSYIERWNGSNPDPELQKLLAERDLICFRADKPATGLGRGRRDEILKTLRKTSLLLLVFLSLGFVNRAQAADVAAEGQTAYEAGKYPEAIKLWQSAGNYKELSPDLLYNIGNACYRMGSPGQAALYFRRALVKNPGHDEARQNLRFIERKYGSITVQYSAFQYTLAKIPLAGWKGIFWAGVWLTCLSVLVFPATRPGARVRIVAVVILIFGPLLTSVGALGWKYFPNDSVFAPLAQQAVIIAPGTVLHADAARTSPEVIDAPQGSLCQIVRITGKWAYVSFASKTRGWVPLSSFEKIVPDSDPGVPKVIKIGEESNA